VKTSLSELLSHIPGAPSEQWPTGERYALAFSHGTMSVGFYAPVGSDPQKPHKRDEIYIIHTGTGKLVIDKTPHPSSRATFSSLHRVSSIASSSFPKTSLLGLCFGVRPVARRSPNHSLERTAMVHSIWWTP
jgi:hypothetical protein